MGVKLHMFYIPLITEHQLWLDLQSVLEFISTIHLHGKALELIF